MQNENTQSTKIMWSIGCTIALLIGLFLFREQWNWILFCLDVRYWPVWTPRLLWILVGLMILNLMTTWYLRLKPCNDTDFTAMKQTVNVDRIVLLSSIKRFALFLLVIEAKIKYQQKSKIEKVVNEESKKADDGGYLANSASVDCFAAYAYRFNGGRYKNEAITFRLRSPDKIESGKTYPLVIKRFLTDIRSKWSKR